MALWKAGAGVTPHLTEGVSWFAGEQSLDACKMRKNRIVDLARASARRVLRALAEARR